MQPLNVVVRSCLAIHCVIKVPFQLLLVVVEQVLGIIIALGYAKWLELAAASTTKGKPNQDAGTKAASRDAVQKRAKGVSVHDVVAQSDRNHQAVRTTVCHLAKCGIVATTNLNQERCDEVGKQAWRAGAAPRKQVIPLRVGGASPRTNKTRKPVAILT